MADDIIIKDGEYIGGWRKPMIPDSMHDRLKGSIHDDESAQKLGMRGGTIAAPVHMNTFAPLLLKAFGQRWWEQGSISLYFQYATLSGEDVRAILGIPSEGAQDAQVVARMETPNGNKVCEGTASVGNPEVPSALKARKLDEYDPGEIRIFASLKPGAPMQGRDDVILKQEDMNKQLENITETMDWYSGKSPWGGPIATPSLMTRAMMIKPEGLPEAVGLFGAFELRNVNGPVLIEHPYRVSGKIVWVGSSPKTEYYWADSWLEERDGSKRVAEMRWLIRRMKASSELWGSSKK